MAEVMAGYNIWILRMKRKFAKAGAISEETAKAPKELNISIDALEKLCEWKVAKRTKDGRYYVPRKEGK